MLPPRVLTALGAIPLVAAVVTSGGWLFFVVTVVLALAALRELELAARERQTPLIGPVAYIAVLVTLITTYLQARGGGSNGPLRELFLLLPWLVAVALMVWAVVVYPTPRRTSLSSVALTLLAIFYVGLFAVLLLLREWPGLLGSRLMWLALLSVWTGDTAAYYAGRAFGRVKLTPLSPGKTREGALAGLIATIAVCAVLTTSMGLGWRHGAVLGVLTGTSGPLGDLVESFWKRELDVKDLGRLLPGHGGVLDRCDSLLFAALAVYCYALWQWGR